MRKIILNLAVTLDGFIEGPNGEIDWCIVDEDIGGTEFLGDLLAEIDTIFYGRISYDMWKSYQPDPGESPQIAKAYASINSMKKFVFSSTKRTDDGATFIDGDIRELVEELRRQPGKNIWLFGGSKLLTSFINMNLVDIYQLAVHPILLGSGKPLFQDIQQRVGLKLLSATPSRSGVVMLHYEADRQ